MSNELDTLTFRRKILHLYACCYIQHGIFYQVVKRCLGEEQADEWKKSSLSGNAWHGINISSLKVLTEIAFPEVNKPCSICNHYDCLGHWNNMWLISANAKRTEILDGAKFIVWDHTLEVAKDTCSLAVESGQSSLAEIMRGNYELIAERVIVHDSEIYDKVCLVDLPEVKLNKDDILTLLLTPSAMEIQSFHYDFKSSVALHLYSIWELMRENDPHYDAWLNRVKECKCETLMVTDLPLEAFAKVSLGSIAPLVRLCGAYCGPSSREEFIQKLGVMA